jgi:succinate dehydrogenase / fumarate reductase cytochrome b subunit
MTMKPRPTSPHLSIYKPQITSVMSILHRITGAVLFAGILLFSWFITASVYWPECYITKTIYDICHHFIGKAVLFLWSFAMFYHMFNGIRHLAWDMGFGFNLDSVNKSGALVLAATTLCTIFAWCMV